MLNVRLAKVRTKNYNRKTSQNSKTFKFMFMFDKIINSNGLKTHYKSCKF